MATRDGGLVARSVREALDTLVSPQMYAQLIQRALASAGLSEVPEQGRAVGSWIQNSLLPELEAAVGSDAAELVAEQLAPVIAHAASVEMRQVEARPSDKARARSQPPRMSSRPVQRNAFGSEIPTGVVSAPAPRRDYAETARTQLTPEQLAKMNAAGHTTRPAAFDPNARELRRVLVASSARGEIEALSGYLYGTANVAPVADLVSLLDVLDDKTLSDPIVLVDCQRPTVHVTSIAAIGEDMPVGTTIVLWGVSDDTWNQLDRERVPGCRWLRCSHEATTGDVGSLVSMLIRRP
jgi:hypothetical protein